jgi:hypothetical protein
MDLQNTLVNNYLEDNEGNIWISTLGKGVYCLNNLYLRSYDEKDGLSNNNVYSIVKDKTGKLLIGTFSGDDILENGKITRLESSSNKSLTDYIHKIKIINDRSYSTSIVTDRKNRTWTGDMTGLILYDGKLTKHINMQTGLPSDEVYSLYYDRDKNLLYAGTSNGISILDIDLFDRFEPPLLKIKMISVKAGDSVFTSYANLIFKPEQNNVYINFKALSFSTPGSVKYKYYLNGEWKQTDNDFLDFISLENGKYELQIMAKSQNTDWSKPYLLSFKVLPRFVETVWFDVLIIIILICMSGFVINRRLKLNNRKIRKELELSERINELKHHALSAMMNPHFIFNSLNSVQYLINSQRNEEANDYIAIMAKLIRKNLDTAGSGFILLSEEINRLKLYLDLEKLRFQDCFSYEVITGTDVKTDSIMIPNMIIQPFVENSLWHGIVGTGNKGILTVSFSFEDVEIDSIICNSLIIKITDNGIGILEAKKNKKEDHISKGIQIIEERLRLLSAKMQLPKPIMFEDLGNTNSNSQGTEVIISLPPPLYKTIIPGSDSLFPPTD